MKGQLIEVTMFQTFSMKYNDVIINGDQINSDKLIKLLSYFLSHTNRTISSNELIDYIWAYEEIDNPIGALKNLVYRLRNILKEKLGIEDLIITGKAAYSFNSQYSVSNDVHIFEECNKEIENGNCDEKLYETIIQLYKGRYMNEIDGDHVTLSKSAYYDSAYVTRVLEYAEMLEIEKRYEEMETIARKAIAINTLDESLYVILIKALYYQREYHQALETYRETSDLLYRALGTNPSSELRAIYEMIKKEKHSGSTDINDIQETLIAEEKHGAFLCEYGAFKDLYHLQSRMMNRLGVCTHLCVVTVNDYSRYEVDKEKNRKYVEKTMQKIQASLVDGLRVGDAIARFSVNQFVILLPVCNYENSVFVMERILKKIRISLNNKKIEITVSIKEVTSAEWEDL